MQPDQLSDDDLAALDATLGYLNFSSGAADPQLFANLDRLYRALNRADSRDGPDSPDSRERPGSSLGSAQGGPSATSRFGAVSPRGSSSQISTWQLLEPLLLSRLEELAAAGTVFRDASQARAIVHLAHDEILPAYREFHRDLLFHQDDAIIFNAFFVGRVYEVVLREHGRDIQETGESVVDAALTTLNDYLGHRPIAVLETDQKINSYAHERIRPVPLYVQGAGVTLSRYESLVAGAIEILESTDESILEQAFFDPELLEELAFDPRAYDFNHPVNRRPNYHFGQWDPSHIDNQGRYRRYVVQQVTLDAILARVTRDSAAQVDQLSNEELLFEASATLAGTILMSTAISGRGPETHTSEATLSSLLPNIASVRDEFYKSLLAKSVESHPHLIEDAKVRQQPFGAARQQLNAELARRRAAQLEHIHLARAFAKMGYAEAAERQAAIVPAASSRIVCQIECRLATGQLLLDRGQINEAASLFPEIIDLLHRGIACGAIVDPWNAIGFDGQFSLFPGIQDSVPDHRLDDLVELMDEIFALLARSWSLAAADDNDEVQTISGSELLKLAIWWDQFAVPTVSGLEAVFAAPLHESAERAATALAAWRSAGTTAGDVAFWRPHAEQFDSPKAYVLVVQALLDQRDYVAAMGMLMHWLSQAERIELQEAGDWFHSLVERWLGQLLDEVTDDDTVGGFDRWTLIGKFFDFLEANAEEYWDAPQLELEALLGEADLDEFEDLEEGEEDEEDDLYRAAYDGISFRDSTDDGIDADLLGSNDETDYELEFEARRITERLTFLVTLSRLWSRTALAAAGDERCRRELESRLDQWLGRALTNRQELLELLSQLANHRVAQASGSFESLLEYDRRINIKEAMLERTTATCRNCATAIWFLRAAGAKCDDAQLEPGEAEFSVVLKAALLGDRQGLAAGWSAWTSELAKQPLLYVPVNRGGDPIQIVATRSLHRSIRLMLGMLPRLGEIERTIRLLELCIASEQTHPLGTRAVTEFADLLHVAHRATADSLIASIESWSQKSSSEADSTADEDQDLIDALQQLTDTTLVIWLAHSRHLRLSILEKVSDSKDWQRTVEFIQRFGGDLFHQQFMNPGNLRSILQSGAAQWLQDATEQVEDPDELPTLALITDQDARREALRQFELVIETVLENHLEYLDYNSTTTQSDRGEMLYALLDLIRVRVIYDRVAWNVTPVVLTHESLVRSRHLSAAAIWQRELASQTDEMADELIGKLNRLQQQHGMRLSTIAARLEERFIRPLAIDRIRALVKPTVESRRRGESSSEFERLEEEVEELTRTPSGVGFDVPEWITALEEEVERATTLSTTLEIERLAHEQVTRRILSRDELDEQLAKLAIDEEE